MNFIATAVTDVGTRKEINQDSACIRIAETNKHGQIVMAAVCDGMGGHESGELASATVIRALSSWFENVLPELIDNDKENEIPQLLENLAREQNKLIDQYAKKKTAELGLEKALTIGTTLTVMLIIDGGYSIVHVGDSRVYQITDSVEQLTEDQTYISREIKAGRMTPEEAAVHPWRNKLLQCVGASKALKPQLSTGKAVSGAVYLLCSDGFRHVISDEEMQAAFNSSALKTKKVMKETCEEYIDLVKSRNEKDNITVVLVKCIN